ncbi:hypothetical protein V6N13_027023 [Hibiscus sabdariffa]
MSWFWPRLVGPSFPMVIKSSAVYAITRILRFIHRNKVLFCKSLQLHHAHHCVFEGCNTATNYSGLELLSGGGRRLLQRPEKGNDRADQNPNRKHIKEYPDSAIIAMVAAGVLLACCVCCLCCICWRKRANAHTVVTEDSNSNSPSEMNILSPRDMIPTTPLRPNPSLFPASPKLRRIGSVHLNMTEVARATCNFSPELRIGEGGFGTVYKALLDSGQVVAIKRAKKEHIEKLQTEFSSEVELLANIDHRNLVKLLGYVNSGDERLIITEYVPNGTLRDHLDGQRGKILDFNQRLEIAIDVAHGLTYLHLYAGKQIIHRDVKSSNILVTESMRAKVADFGFARVEILTGRRPVDLRRPYRDRVTLTWAFRRYNEGHVAELVDSMMEEAVDAEILLKIFALAFQCAAPTRNDRPQMKSVAEQLWGIRADYLKTSRRG